MGRSGRINLVAERRQRLRARRRWLRARLRETRHRGCPGCGKTFNTTDRSPTVDHVVPTSRGGADEESNWQVLCQLCNVRKADRMPVASLRAAEGKEPSLSPKAATSLPSGTGEREQDGRRDVAPTGAEEDLR